MTVCSLLLSKFAKYLTYVAILNGDISGLMKKVLLTLSLCLSLAIAFAQQHYLYLQTDNQQPFYLKINGKILSSSASGYIVIGKVKDGEYKLSIGFPKDQWPEQSVTVNINKNTGYQVKNFGEKGWGLFNLETLEIIMASPTVSASTDSLEKKTDDMSFGHASFIEMLSDIVNDPKIKDGDEAKNDPSLDNITFDVNTFNEGDSTDKAADTTSGSSYTHIEKKLENADQYGIDRIYTDSTGGNTDTIRVFIPLAVEKKAEGDTTSTALNDTNKIHTDTTAVVMAPDSTVITKIKDEKNPDTVAIVINKDTLATDTKKQETPSDSSTVKKEDKKTGEITFTTNANCKGIASEQDFLKLRKKMAAENNEEDMIAAAKKYFKNKCFSTEYIKNLSVLFLKDQGKYAFFDMAYPYVTDGENFASLEKEMTDEYYLNRFRAMVKK
jgi:hypothetical protein